MATNLAVSMMVLTAGLLPLAILRHREAPSAPSRPLDRRALIALSRLHDVRLAPLMSKPMPLVVPDEPALPTDVVSLDAYRVDRARAVHPAGRGRVRRSRGA